MKSDFHLLFLGVLLGYLLSTISTHWALLIVAVMIVIAIVGTQRSKRS